MRARENVKKSEFHTLFNGILNNGFRKLVGLRGRIYWHNIAFSLCETYRPSCKVSWPFTAYATFKVLAQILKREEQVFLAPVLKTICDTLRVQSAVDVLQIVPNVILP